MLNSKKCYRTFEFNVPAWRRFGLNLRKILGNKKSWTFRLFCKLLIHNTWITWILETLNTLCKDSLVQYKRKIYKRNICWAYPRHFSSKHYFNTNKRGVNIRVINYQGAPVIIYWSLNDHRESYDHLEDKVG